MELPLLLSNKDWEDLRPPEVASLGEDPNLDPQQKAFLRFCRTVDQRAEWACRQQVLTRNLVVLLAIAVVAVSGPQIHAWFFK
jgi:hypothetical protein